MGDSFLYVLLQKCAVRVGNMVGKTEKALTARLRKGLYYLVAGAGFEPTTFGL